MRASTKIAASEVKAATTPAVPTYKEVLALYPMASGACWGSAEEIADQLERAMMTGRLRIVQNLLDDEAVRTTLEFAGLLELACRAASWRRQAESHERTNGRFSRLDLNDEFNARMLPYWQSEGNRR